MIRNVYLTKKTSASNQKATKADLVIHPGTLDVKSLSDEIGKVAGAIYIDDLAHISLSSKKAIEWDKSWDVIDLFLGAGNKVVFVSEGIELTGKESVSYKALSGAANAIKAIRMKRNDKYKARINELIASGENPTGWVQPDEDLINLLVNKKNELGVMGACEVVGISKQTYYRWKKKYKF